MLRASRFPQLQAIEDARRRGVNNLFGLMVAPTAWEALDNLLERSFEEFEALEAALVTGSEFFWA